MERKKHKRLTDTIMKPEDLKKARIQKNGGPAAIPSTSSSSGGLKAKLDFRSVSSTVPKTNQHLMAAGPSLQSSNVARPILDEKWKEFGDTINLNLETFAKSIKEAIELDKFNKVARMLVAALKSFVQDEKIVIEYRLAGTLAETIKNHGNRLNHLPLHRGMLFILCHARSLQEDLLQLFVLMTTSLAEQQPMLDKCYIAAYLHDTIGMNTGIGTTNRCTWIDKPYAEKLVRMITAPFATVFPDPEMYAASQVDNFVMSEWMPKERLASRTNDEQLSVFLEFLKPWFDLVRGELLPKPLFRVLSLLCGYDQIRFFVASRLEVWITLQKFHREISELLLALGCNIDASKSLDKDVIDILLKLNTKNMKTRTISGPFGVAIRKSCEQKGNVLAIFESLIMNETGPAQNRSSANMTTFSMLLGYQPNEATQALAQVCAKELLREKEMISKMLMMFLKELMRLFYQTRTDEFPFSIFASNFLDTVLKNGGSDEVILLAVELTSQIPLIAISCLLVLRENVFSTKYKQPTLAGDNLLMPPEARIAREQFQREFQLYSEAVIEWLSKARRVFPDESVYIGCYSLLLFLDPQREVYTSGETSAIPEQDIPNCLRIFGECGISERMLLLLLQEKNSQLPAKAIIDLTTALTQRAALNHPHFIGDPLVKLTDPFKLIDSLLEMTILPETVNSKFPGMPPLCSRSLYWSAWNSILLWIAGGGTVPFFDKIYEAYPILRYLIRCVLTEKFEFPMDFEGRRAFEMQANEDAAVKTENTVIRTYEKKMIKEKGSLAEFFCIYPKKKSFRAPKLLDETRLLSSKFKLASRLAQSTSPPLLSLLVSQVGAENSLYAVREMLIADNSTASSLTAECVFHALLYYFDNQRHRERQDPTTNHVISALIRQAEINFSSVVPIEKDVLLQSLVSSLASTNNIVRTAVVNTFARLFPSRDKPFDLFRLSTLPRFESDKVLYLERLAKAILVETNKKLANEYLHFLTRNCLCDDNIHMLARSVCHTLSDDRSYLHASLCEYFLQYIDRCIEKYSVKDPKSVNDDTLCCVEIGAHRVALSKEVPVAVIKLLSAYETSSDGSNRDIPFESLVESWLSPGEIPKVVDRETGIGRHILTLPMRKAMLKSPDQRVVDAALEELSETDAQEFILVSQMSKETAEKVIGKAENMNLIGIDKKALSNMYLLLRGYRLKGIRSGEMLAHRMAAEIDRLETFEAKEELMDVMETSHDQQPGEFIAPAEGSGQFAILENVPKMPETEISAWLKTNCFLPLQTSTKKEKEPPAPFRLPSSFVQTAINDRESALACLQHIEANLKFFLSHESAFQTLIGIVDAASNKFPFVQKRLENLAVRLLKSVSPPVSVASIFRKHAHNSRTSITKKKSVPMKASTFAEFAAAAKGISSEREKFVVDQFMSNFVEDKGEVIEVRDVVVFVNSLRKVYAGEDAEITAERCLSNRWTPQLQKTVLSSLLEKFRSSVCSVFLFRLLAAYCKKHPISSCSELFMFRDKSNQLVVNKNIIQTLVIYFADVATNDPEYDIRIVNLIADIEKQGHVPIGFEFGNAFIQTSCAYPKAVFRKTARRLLEAVADRLSYISYKNGHTSSIRVLTNVETRESVIRRCEQIVDRIVEMKMDPKLALAEDVCEEERPTVKDSKTMDEDPKILASGSKRPFDPRGGYRNNGPPIKKGRFLAAKDLPIPMIGGNGGSTTPVREDPAPEEQPRRREWIATSHAMTRFNALIREHPKIVKIKLPVLATYVARVTAMTKRELREEHRVGKVELILRAIIKLCPVMKSDEMGSVDTALANSFEFYEKHFEEGGFGIKEQTSFAELVVRACAQYLTNSLTEARAFLQDNRLLVERVCMRCHNRYDVDLVLDNIVDSSPSA